MRRVNSDHFRDLMTSTMHGGLMENDCGLLDFKCVYIAGIESGSSVSSYVALFTMSGISSGQRSELRK